jgi:hypothetical protein
MSWKVFWRRAENWSPVKGADFVSAINKAQDAETKQELGYSLSWYAIAQRFYPASQIANQAIDRLSKNILAKSGV